MAKRRRGRRVMFRMREGEGEVNGKRNILDGYFTKRFSNRA